MTILVLGGESSGKSSIGEKIAVTINSGKLAYIAAMQPIDKECLEKIKNHRYIRKNKNFTTIEEYFNLNNITLDGFDTAILECISNLTANIMFSGLKIENITSFIIDSTFNLSKKIKNLIIISNEIFSDGIEYNTETNKYIEYMGKINCELAEKSDVVIEAVCGIPIYLKGEAI